MQQRSNISLHFKMIQKLSRLVPLNFFTIIIAHSVLFFLSIAQDANTNPITQVPYIVKNQKYYPVPHSIGYKETGVASWYGRPFHGRKTSNGERYNMYDLTAAHKTLPMGTTVLVKNLENHKEIILRINDRGPFVRGRIIDVSYKAAKKLGFIKKGTTRVHLIALSKNDPKQPYEHRRDLRQGNFFVQIGAFTKIANAQRMRDRFTRHGHHTIIKEYRRGSLDSLLYRVQVYAGTTLENAVRAEKALIEHGYVGAFVIAH